MSGIVTAFAGAASILMVAGIILFPGHAFDASLNGLRLWWDTVFPALLPFYIVCCMIEAWRLPHLWAARLSPLIRLLLGIRSHAAGSALSALFAGPEAGARAIAELRAASVIGSEEASRLIPLVYFTNPALLIAVIAAAWLQAPAVGVHLALIHYSSAWLTISVFRIAYAANKQPIAATSASALTLSNAQPLGPAQPSSNAQPLGKLLGDAVHTSLQRLMIIGGTMMICSVLLRLLQESGIVAAAVALAQAFAARLLPSTAGDAIVLLLSALTEVHMGAALIAHTAHLPAATIIIAVSAMLGWGGVALHLHIRAILHGTAVRYKPFLAARLLHAALAGLIAALASPLIPAALRAAPQAIDAAAAHGQSPLPFGELFAAWQPVIFAAMLILMIWRQTRHS